MKRSYTLAVEHYHRIADSQSGKWPDGQWHGEIRNCDVCSRPMADELFMIDGPAESGPEPRWGNICVVCAYKYSPQIGWGKAQLFKLDKEGIWRLMAGGPPATSF